MGRGVDGVDGVDGCPRRARYDGCRSRRAHRSERWSRIRRQPGPYDLARVPRFNTFARSNSARDPSLLQSTRVAKKSRAVQASSRTSEKNLRPARRKTSMR